MQSRAQDSRGRGGFGLLTALSWQEMHNVPRVAEQGEVQRTAVHVRSVFLKIFQPHYPILSIKTIQVPAVVSI